MRFTLLASAITATIAISDELSEILALGVTNEWLIDHLSSSALFGRHHLRSARAAECTDKHDSCEEYTNYCENEQFRNTCSVTCNACEDSVEDEPPAAIDEVETEVDECADTMHYCDSMGKYCDNIEYQGVRLYCRKTCKSCDEEIVPQNNATTSENAEGAGDSSCEDKSWCTNFSYCTESQQLRERIVNDCPIQCKKAQCEAEWRDASETHHTQGLTTTPEQAGSDDECSDQSLSCEGIAELCDNPNYQGTLTTYCEKTCNFCTVSDTPSVSKEVAKSDECINQYPNCEDMKFMCSNTNDAFNSRYRDLCPLTCGICTASGGTAEEVTPEQPTGNAVQPVGPSSGSSVCEDKATNCNELEAFCKQENTQSMMKERCSLTCRFCTAENDVVEEPAQEEVPTADPNTCEDQPGQDCAKYMSYCTNKTTKVPELCKKSCGLCPGDEPVTEESRVLATTTTTTTLQSTTTSAVTVAPEVTVPECILAKSDKTNTCDKYAKYCNNPKYKKKLSFQCPLTCKVCQKPPAAVVETDEARTGVEAAAPTCVDKVPKQCSSLKIHCKKPKYAKVLKQKCEKTCEFCGAGASTDASAVAVTPKPSTDEKYGPWSIQFSKCSTKCQQYQRRNCKQPPCPKTSLYKFRKCPAEQNPNIAACQSGSSAAKPVNVCRDKSPQCKKYAKMCKNASVSSQCLQTCGKCSSRRRRSVPEEPIHNRWRRAWNFGQPFWRSAAPEVCEDKIPCQNFVMFGWCKARDSTTHTTMTTNCKKACGFCRVMPKKIAIWSPWASWSACTKSCGGGIQNKKRTCIAGTCAGSTFATNLCNLNNCPTTTTQRPTTTTQRPIPTPPSRYTAGTCVDKHTYCRSVSKDQCSTNPTLAIDCAKTCGCIPGVSADGPKNGGGVWLDWSTWTSCQGSCMAGFQRNRARKCGEYGRTCDGSTTEKQTCDIGFDCNLNRYFTCNDEAANCADFALEGRCFDINYKNWMAEKCPASCKMCPGLRPMWSSWSPCSPTRGDCGRGKKIRRSDVLTEELSCMIECDHSSAPTTVDCKDTHPFCPQLHSKCEFEKSVKDACKKTCDTCEKTEAVSSNCFDKNKDICDTKADEINCKREEYQLMCPRTCDSCDKIEAQYAQKTENTCKDLSAACEDPNVKNQCPSNMWIRQNCKISCGTCGENANQGLISTQPATPENNCVDKSRSCTSWRSMCKTQASIMNVKCPVTCGICTPPPTTQPPTTTTTTATTTVKYVEPEVTCLNGPLCEHYASSFELNCRDSKSFREQCPILCRINECAAYFDQIEMPISTDEIEKRWKEWATWTDCSKTCGGGERSRTRDCKAPLHQPCTYGDDSETGLCNKNDCEEVIVVYENKKCEDHKNCEGFQSNFCSDPSISSMCPKMCDTCKAYWDEWQEWSVCSTSCRGTGTQTRVRNCVQVGTQLEECGGPSEEGQNCADLEVCYDDWSSWTSCTETCGNGTVSRQRVCTEPENCDWVENEQDYCEGLCIGEFEEWSEWAECSVTCGNGTVTRERKCPEELNCEGETDEVQTCELDKCIRYLDWSEWNECTVTCGKGEKRRSRECSEPDQCYSMGASGEIFPCSTEACPVKVEWAEWATFSPCSEQYVSKPPKKLY